MALASPMKTVPSIGDYRFKRQCGDNTHVLELRSLESKEGAAIGNPYPVTILSMAFLSEAKPEGCPLGLRNCSQPSPSERKDSCLGLRN